MYEESSVGLQRQR